MLLKQLRISSDKHFATENKSIYYLYAQKYPTKLNKSYHTTVHEVFIYLNFFLGIRNLITVMKLERGHFLLNLAPFDLQGLTLLSVIPVIFSFVHLISFQFQESKLHKCGTTVTYVSNRG